MITVTLSNKRHLAAATAAYLATIPTQPDPPAESIPAPYASVDAYVQTAIERVAESWRDSNASDRISTTEFLMRFTPTEFTALKTATASDPIAAALLARLSSDPYVWLGSDEAQQGVGYLVATGLLTADRGAVVLHYDVPSVP